jgi:hypothetical protein
MLLVAGVYSFWAIPAEKVDIESQSGGPFEDRNTDLLGATRKYG